MTFKQSVITYRWEVKCLQQDTIEFSWSFNNISFSKYFFTVCSHRIAETHFITHTHTQTYQMLSSHWLLIYSAWIDITTVKWHFKLRWFFKFHFYNGFTLFIYLLWNQGHAQRHHLVSRSCPQEVEVIGAAPTGWLHLGVWG